MNLYGILSVYSTVRYIIKTLFSSKIIFSPININGNISYEGTFKHRKYRCDYWVIFFIFFIENYD